MKFFNLLNFCLFNTVLSLSENINLPKILIGNSEIMNQKIHGTCKLKTSDNIKFGCSRELCDNICCFNRKFAEKENYWSDTSFIQDIIYDIWNEEPIYFYDTISNIPLFYAPINRNWSDFLYETLNHGWPSFRLDEVIKENVRILDSGEVVSVEGTHLGHLLSDKLGYRFCINLVSISGKG